jgi:hypothetical protein
MDIKENFYSKLQQLREAEDSLSGGLKRTDLGLSDKLDKKGKLSKKTQKWMKTLAHGSGSLYSRSLGKPKGHLPEESEQIDEISSGRANDAYHAAAEKGKKADIIAGLTKSEKSKNAADKMWSRARKFADYSDKKKK